MGEKKFYPGHMGTYDLQPNEWDENESPLFKVIMDHHSIVPWLPSAGRTMAFSVSITCIKLSLATCCCMTIHFAMLRSLPHRCAHSAEETRPFIITRQGRGMLEWLLATPRHVSCLFSLMSESLHISDSWTMVWACVWASSLGHHGYLIWSRAPCTEEQC